MSTLPPEVIRATLAKNPSLLFDLGQMLGVSAGPWERQEDARTMEEWVRLRAIPGPDGRLYAARVWMDEDLSGMHGLVLWRWGVWTWTHTNGLVINESVLETAKSAEHGREQADAALADKGWRLA